MALTGDRNRILYLVPDLVKEHGGIARHARTVCQALSDVGFSLSVIALHGPQQPQGDVVMNCPRVTCTACGGRRDVFVRRAAEALRERPALVLVEHPNFSTLGWLLARISRAPFVVFAHGIEIWRPLSPLRQRAFRHANRVLTVSEFTKGRAVAANGVKRAKIHVLHNCLPPAFRIAPMSPPFDSPTSLLTVSRMSTTEGYKGHEQVICSLPALLDEFPELVYDVVGNGDLRPELERLAAECGVAPAVRFHGTVSEAELEGFYARASIFVMPSRAEGFGYVFVEAMAHGKPVVAGNQDASVEVVQDGQTGFLVDPADIGALTERLARLLRSPELREQMGAAGRDVVRSQFSFDTFRSNLATNLLEVLDVRPGRHESTRS